MPQVIIDAHKTGFILKHPMPSLPERREPHKRDAGEWKDTPYNSALPEQRLWRAVIMQAMLDACMKNPNRPELIEHKQDAIIFLTQGGEPFIDICEHAGLDHRLVRARAKRAIANPGHWRVEAGLSERYQQRKETRMSRRAERRKRRIEQVPQAVGCVIYNIFN